VKVGDLVRMWDQIYIISDIRKDNMGRRYADVVHSVTLETGGYFLMDFDNSAGSSNPYVELVSASR
jgi:hypothetical protein